MEAGGARSEARANLFGVSKKQQIMEHNTF